MQPVTVRPCAFGKYTRIYGVSAILKTAFVRCVLARLQYSIALRSRGHRGVARQAALLTGQHAILAAALFTEVPSR